MVKGESDIKKLGYIEAMASATIFGMMPLFTKILISYGNDAISCTFYRMSLSLVFIFVLAKFFFKQSMAIDRGELKRISFAAICFMLTSLTLYRSYQYINSGTATSIHFLYPVIIFIMTVIILRTRPKLIEVLCIIFATLGLLMIMDFKEISNTRGLLYAFASAIVYSFYSTFIGWSKLKTMKPLKLLFYVNAMSSGFLFLYSKLFGLEIYHQFNWHQWCIIIIYSLILTVGATLLYQRAIMRIGAKETSILSTLEPVVSIMIGYLLLKEKLSKFQLIAILLILISGFMIVITQFLREKHESIKL